jgi:hypothetical protein
MHAHVTVGCVHVHALLLVTLLLRLELLALRYLSTEIVTVSDLLVSILLPH